MRGVIRFLLFVFSLTLSPVVAGESFTVAAASSLQFVLRDVAEEYERKTKLPAPRLIFGSSGNLYRQILQGAPYDLFFSARSELVIQLSDTGLGVDGGQRFGIGRLVLLYGDDTPLFDSLSDAVKTGVVQNKSKLAIANPAHAPYGRAAKQALQALQLWEATNDSVVNGEQVSQAAQFVTSGAVPFGLVSLTLALAPSVAAVTKYQLIDDQLHEPIELQMVRISGDNKAAQRFYDFILQDASINKIFQRYGLR